VAMLASEIVTACLAQTSFEIIIPMPQRSPSLQ